MSSGFQSAWNGPSVVPWPAAVSQMPAEVTAALRAAMAKVSSRSSGVVLVKSVTSLEA